MQQPSPLLAIGILAVCKETIWVFRGPLRTGEAKKMGRKTRGGERARMHTQTGQAKLTFNLCKGCEIQLEGHSIFIAAAGSSKERNILNQVTQYTHVQYNNALISLKNIKLKKVSKLLNELRLDES